MGYRRSLRTLLPLAVTLAQGASAAPPAQPAAGAPAPAPTPAATGEPAPLPTIQDPMLEPVPAAANQLTSFKQALELVRAQATQLRIARATVAQAEGTTRSAYAHALPTLNGVATVNRHLLLGTGNAITSAGVIPNTTIPNPATTFNAQLQLTVPLLAAGAWHAIGTAKERVRAAELSQKDSERLLLAAVAQTAVAEVTQNRVAESSRVSLSSALSTLDLNKRKAQLGAASALDVLRADADVASARTLVVSADEALRQAREALGAALGDTHQWGVSPGIQIEELTRTTVAVCKPVGDLETRADILAAKKNVHVAERDRDQVDYLYAPTVNGTSTLLYNPRANSNPNDEHVTWTVGAILNWPIFDGGDRYGQAKSAEATAEIARQNLVQQRRNAIVLIVQAERAVAVAQANLDVSTATRDIDKEKARLAKLAFMNGSGTSFDLIDSAKALRAAEIDLIVKDFDLFEAKIAAFLASANCSI